MASDGSTDVAALLAPISEATPAGVDLRADPKTAAIYYEIKDARSAARAAERKAESDEEPSEGVPPEWDKILTLAPTILTEQSKDLEVTAWYIEALLRARGFAGLRDGFAIATGLVDQYWDTFFSLQDEDGLETRLAPLTGLNGSGSDGALIQPILKVPITAPNGDDGPFSLYHFQQASDLLKFADPEVRARKVESGAVTLERFGAAVSASGGPFYVALLAEIEGALAQFTTLSAALDAKAGADSPPTSNIRDRLTGVLDTVRGASKDLVASAAPVAASAEAGAAGSGAAAAAGPASADGLRSREDALRMLLQIATYFRASEPQSPIANVLEETVRRARLSFADLLADLLPDASSWKLALTNAGIKPPPDPS